MAIFHRREFIRLAGLATTAITTNGLFNKIYANPSNKKHIITLSFDDGFKKSSLLTAEIFEKHKLPACINVIATGHLPGFESPDAWQVTPKGDFVLWNELQDRGHEIMPHGYKHANKTQIPLQEAKDLISKCLDYFSKNLKGFEAKRSIFNFPYNSSTAEIEQWLENEVMAFRTAGPSINTLPHKGQKKLTCGAFGPGSTEEHLEGEIKNLLAQPSGWLIYNVHGIDGEGWGPMSYQFLDSLLGRLTTIDSVTILPAGRALASVYS